MRKGISIWAFPDRDYRTCFPLAKRCGYDGIELSFEETGILSPTFEAACLTEIRNAAAECGLSLYSLASDLYWKYSLTAEDSSVRRKAASLVRAQLDAAALLGCDTILVLPGMVSAPGDKGPAVPYDVAYDRAAESLTALAAYAAEKGVIIGVENVWNKFLLSPLEMRNFLDQIGSPWVRAYFDVGNVVRDGYPEQWIRILGKRIAKVHLKDYKRDCGTLEGFTELLAGDVDFDAVLRALRETGYDGWLTAEFSPYRVYPEVLLENTWNAMHHMIDQ